MKQIMRKVVAIVAIVGVSYTANAQLSLGGGALYTGYNSLSFIGGSFPINWQEY